MALRDSEQQTILISSNETNLQGSFVKISARTKNIDSKIQLVEGQETATQFFIQEIGIKSSSIMPGSISMNFDVSETQKDFSRLADFNNIDSAIITTPLSAENKNIYLLENLHLIITYHINIGQGRYEYGIIPSSEIDMSKNGFVSFGTKGFGNYQLAWVNDVHSALGFRAETNLEPLSRKQNANFVSIMNFNLPEVAFDPANETINFKGSYQGLGIILEECFIIMDSDRIPPWDDIGNPGPRLNHTFYTSSDFAWYYQTECTDTYGRTFSSGWSTSAVTGFTLGSQAYLTFNRGEFEKVNQQMVTSNIVTARSIDINKDGFEDQIWLYYTDENPKPIIGSILGNKDLEWDHVSGRYVDSDGCSTPIDMTLADINGDHLTDVYILCSDKVYSMTGDVITGTRTPNNKFLNTNSYDITNGQAIITINADASNLNNTDDAKMIEGAAIINNEGVTIVDGGVIVNFPTIETNYSPVDLIAADLNQDGLDDIVALRSQDNNSHLDILIRNPEQALSATSFTKYSLALPGIDGLELESGKLNNDQLPDLLIRQDNSIVVLHGNGNSFSFAPYNEHLNFSSNLGDMVIGDFNGDRSQDILLAIPGESKVHMIPNNTAKSFSKGSDFLTSSNPSQLIVNDIDNDHIFDLLVYDSQNKTFGYQLGTGLLQPSGGDFHQSDDYAFEIKHDDLELENSFNIDLNQDKLTDIIALSRASSDGQRGSIHLFVNEGINTKGTPLFEHKVYENPLSDDAFISPHDLAFGDLNSDGLPEVVVATRNQVLVFENQTNNELQLIQKVLPDISKTVTGIAMHDLDTDGYPELIIAYEGIDGSGPETAGFYQIYSGDNLRFDNPQPPVKTSSYKPGRIELGDLNRDGQTDMVISDDDSHRIGVYLGQGLTFLSMESNITIDIEDTCNGPDNAINCDNNKIEDNPDELKVADIDNDGYLDIITGSTKYNCLGSIYGNRSILDNSDLSSSWNGQSECPLVNNFPGVNLNYLRSFVPVNLDNDPTNEILLATDTLVHLFKTTEKKLQKTKKTYAPLGKQVNIGGVQADADYNGDGIPDLMIFTLGNGQPETSGLTIRLGSP